MHPTDEPAPGPTPQTTVRGIEDPEDMGLDPLQHQVLDAYMALTAHRSSWASRLILLLSAEPPVAAVAFAGIIAGALVLTLDADADRQRAALRSGAAHFVVKHADEALRVLKNEARRGTPLSVGLETDPAVDLPELVRRGLLPSLVLDAEPAAELRPAPARGLEVAASATSALEATPVAAALAAFAAAGCTLWTRAHLRELATASIPAGQTRHHYRFPSSRDRSDFDKRLFVQLPSMDIQRRSWIHAAGRVLPRATVVTRSLYLTADEAATVAAALL